MRIKSQNHALYCETHGQREGTPVIFLHHGLGSTRSWRKQVDAFTENGFFVINYDRWGYGQSSDRSVFSPPDFKEDVIDLIAVLDQFEIQEGALVGHSDGGTIALQMAIQHPERVTAMVLAAAHIYLEPKMEPGIQGIVDSYQDNRKFRKGLVDAHGDRAEKLIHQWYEGWHLPDVQAWDMRPELSSVQCPVLVIQGAQDEHTLPQHAADIAQGIPNAVLEIVEGGVHMLPQTEDKMFNTRVIGFIKQASPITT